MAMMLPFIYKMNPPEALAFLLGMFSVVNTTGRGSHRFEWTGRRFDGQEVPLEVVVTSVQVDGRSLNVSVVRDITERKRTEVALR